MKHRPGRDRRLNCHLLVIALLLRGRLRGVVAVWDAPVPHLMGVTGRGNLVHFRRTRGTPRTCSLWFTGRVEVVSASCLSEIQSAKQVLRW